MSSFRGALSPNLAGWIIAFSTVQNIRHVINVMFTERRDLLESAKKGQNRFPTPGIELERCQMIEREDRHWLELTPGLVGTSGMRATNPSH